MIINTEGTHVQVIEFESLREFIKTQTSHYILKFDDGSKEAIYYTVLDTAHFMVLAFAVDKNFECENIRIESDKIVPTNELTGNTITLAKVEMDTFLEDTIEAYHKEKKKRCKQK